MGGKKKRRTQLGGRRGRRGEVRVARALLPLLPIHRVGSLKKQVDRMMGQIGNTEALGEVLQEQLDSFIRSAQGAPPGAGGGGGGAGDMPPPAPPTGPKRH